MVLSVSLLVLVGTGLLSCALRMVLSVSLLVLAGKDCDPALGCVRTSWGLIDPRVAYASFIQNACFTALASFYRKLLTHV